MIQNILHIHVLLKKKVLDFFPNTNYLNFFELIFVENLEEKWVAEVGGGIIAAPENAPRSNQEEGGEG